MLKLDFLKQSGDHADAEYDSLNCLLPVPYFMNKNFTDLNCKLNRSESESGTMVKGYTIFD